LLEDVAFELENFTIGTDIIPEWKHEGGDAPAEMEG
jgi:hypothetical protein